MTNDDGLGVEPGTTAVEEAAESRSLLDRLKKRRDERPDILTLDIPSWDGELKADYQLVTRSDLEQMARKVRQRAQVSEKVGDDQNSGLRADIDFLVKACVRVHAHDSETSEEMEVGTGYNAGVAAALGNPEGTDNTTGLVLYLFKNNGIAVSAHALKIARWMQDTSKSVEDPQ
jgi:hypothetical protein